jgi:hypothetical protein
MSYGFAGSLPEMARKNAAIPVQLGPEMLTNGGFLTDTTWIKGNGWAIAAGVATVALPLAASTLTQAVSVISGRTYLASFALSAFVGGAVRVRLQNSGANASNQPAYAVNGTYSVLLTATGTGNEFAFLATNSSASLSVGAASLRLVL